MESMSLAWRAPEVRSRTVYLIVWGLLALPLPVDLWIGYLRHPGDEAARQWMNVDLGLWAIRILVLSLSISPIATLAGRPGLVGRYRRMVSLFVFTYAMIHSIDYVVYAHAWRIPLRIWERRLYLPVGIGASLLMIPLAVTSFDGLRRAMGPGAWKALHASVYAVALLVIVHTLWEYLSNPIEAAIYCAAIAGLLLLRLPPVMAALIRLQPAPADAAGNTSRLAS